MELIEISRLLNRKLIGENKKVVNLAYNSADVIDGSVFFAIKGSTENGHRYIEEAINKGAIAVIGEEDLPSLTVPYFKVYNTKKALALTADYFYGAPSKKLHLLGVTGTNGKTTVTSLIHDVFNQLGVKSGLIGTNGWWMGASKAATHTTPMSSDLNQLLRDGMRHQLTHVVMEVSSHGIKENRVDQIDFNRFIFTNLTEDHLDYHPTMADYAYTKMIPFIQFSDYTEDKIAIINIDDPYGVNFMNATNGKMLTYGISQAADINARDIIYGMDDTKFALYLGGQLITKLTVPIFGKYNLYNILAVLTYFHSLNYQLTEIAAILENISPIEGRFETIKTQSGITAIIDYAHNADAVYQVLTALNTVAKGDIITVLGAGGGRDKGKRKRMGRYAIKLSKQVIFTSDNPRDENPLDIVYDLIADVTHADYQIVLDREKAITKALERAKPNDYVVILGKGHEKTQNINGNVIPFSDKIVVEEVIRKRGI